MQLFCKPNSEANKTTVLLIPHIIFQSLFLLAALVSCQEHHHLKIAEKLAIPHHIRHAYDYPQINLQRPAAPAQVQQPQRAFSQPDFMRQPEVSSFMRQPEVSSFMRQPEVGSFMRQPESFGRQPEVRPGSQPVRQTRFFNLYTPGSGPNFSLERRQSSWGGIDEVSCWDFSRGKKGWVTADFP